MSHRMTKMRHRMTMTPLTRRLAFNIIMIIIITHSYRHHIMRLIHLMKMRGVW